MSSPITVRPIRPTDIERCSDLLAARHRADSQAIPFLEPALSDSAGSRPFVDALHTNQRADGVVAEIDGTVVGFLFGERMDLSPLDMASIFVPPHSVAMPIEGHAVAESVDVTAVYRAMYAALAADWTRAGYFIHRISIPAANLAIHQAWVELAFGRYLTAATRPTAEPVRGRLPVTVDIRRASPEDIDDVMALVDSLNAHHWEAPIFWPNLRETDDAAREFNLGQLRSAKAPYFIAYQEGRPAGMQSFLRPGFTPPIVAGARNVYLYDGVVDDGARGTGIGTALLAHAMQWAREEGLETCTLHFASPNPSGGPFWLGHGFVPVEHTMERRIDERLAWARPLRRP